MELNNHWINIPLEDLTVHVIGGDWGKESDFIEDGYEAVACIRGSEFKHWKIDFGRTAVIRKIKISSMKTRALLKGDILVEISGGGPEQPVGRTVLISDTVLKQHNLPVVCTNFIRMMRLAPCINSVFVNRYLELFYLSGEVIKYQGGSNNLRNLKFKDYSKINIPLPSYAEQKIIADKLDDLLARVESIKTRLENIPEILKKFRQSVLSAAVSYGTENKSFSKVKLSDICRFQNGYAFKSDCFSKDGVHQVIKLANIRDGYLLLQNSPSYISSDLFNEYDLYVPDEGDILISMTGTRFKKDYGFACFIKDSVNNFVINQRVGRFIPLKNIVSPKFLYLFIRSELFRNEFFKGETGGVNQGNVGSKHILSIDINLPPLDEQEKIAHKADNILSFINSLENKIVDSLSRVNNLTQSILAKAFRGELTAQWREENPELISGLNSAEALLEKITAEKLAAGTVKKRAKKTSH